MRTCQILKDDEWTNINFEELKKDNKFRLFDDGVLVKDNDGFSIFTALNDAYMNEEGIYQVDVSGTITDWLMGR